MSVIIDLSARRAERKSTVSEERKPEESAEILVYTGVRYEIRQAEPPLIADQSQRGQK
ncbi:MAG: hypothetical protein AAF724_05085 [Pseudomonadota bacterium]